MLPDDWSKSAKIISKLLTSHPEAASLLAEASNRQALAACSVADTVVKFGAAQAARLAYEELRHRLDPRRSHPIHFGVGVLLLLLLGAGLTMLDLIELGGLLGGPRSVWPALAAGVVWLTIAWLAAVAVRQRRRTLVSAITGAAILLALLLAALQGFAPHPGRSASGHGSAVFGAFTGAFILVLAAGAGALIARMEQASLLVARRRWHWARTAHKEAVETEHSDLEAATVAMQSWLGLVRAWVIANVSGDKRLVQRTVTLAAALLESGLPALPPSD